MKRIAFALLMMSAVSAQASDKYYKLNLTDTNNDSFVGTVVYNTVKDILTSASGALTYADGYTDTRFRPLVQLLAPGQTGTTFASTVGENGWVDGVMGPTGYGFTGLLFVVLDGAPGTPNPSLNQDSFISDNNGDTYLMTSGSMVESVPEAEEWAMMLVGLPLIAWVARGKRQA